MLIPTNLSQFPELPENPRVCDVSGSCQSSQLTIDGFPRSLGLLVVNLAGIILVVDLVAVVKGLVLSSFVTCNKTKKKTDSW